MVCVCVRACGRAPCVVAFLQHVLLRFCKMGCCVFCNMFVFGNMRKPIRSLTTISKRKNLSPCNWVREEHNDVTFAEINFKIHNKQGRSKPRLMRFFATNAFFSAVDRDVAKVQFPWKRVRENPNFFSIKICYNVLVKARNLAAVALYTFTLLLTVTFYRGILDTLAMKRPINNIKKGFCCFIRILFLPKTTKEINFWVLWRLR